MFGFVFCSLGIVFHTFLNAHAFNMLKVQISEQKYNGQHLCHLTYSSSLTTIEGSVLCPMPCGYDRIISS